MRLLLSALILCSLNVSVMAWNKPGHMVVAEIAYQKIKDDPELWAKIKVLIDAHPESALLEENMPPTLAGEEVYHYKFLRMAAFPDLVKPTPFKPKTPEATRLEKTYSHPKWHYINLPYELDGVKGKPQNFDDWAEGTDLTKINIYQAFQKSLGEVKGHGSDKDRAVSLCWVLHLTGDVHQPLHTTALFSAEHPDGDLGGNDIPVGKSNLHALWDDIVQSSMEFKSIVNKADDLKGDYPVDSFGAQLEEPDFKHWIFDGFATAQDFAYNHGALLAATSRDPAYMSRARKEAKRRVTLAGYRLASILTDALK